MVTAKGKKYTCTSFVANKRISIICTDTIKKNNWELIEGVRSLLDEKWEIKCWDNAGLIGNRIQNLKRLTGYFIHSFQIFFQRKKYNKIIAWQQFYGLIFAFYCMIFKTRKVNKLIITTFIYKRKTGKIGKIYKHFIKAIVQSEYVDKIVVYSHSEINYYAKTFDVPQNKFCFMPLGISEAKKLERTKEKLKKPFLLSVGRSNRDYEFLFKCAEKILMPIVLITDINFNSIPENVILFNNTIGDEYLKILNECYAVLVPLKDINISSGQLVMLQAMQRGKPMVITESNTIGDYVENNVNAVISPKNESVFIKLVNRLIDDSLLYKRLSDNSYRIYKERFTLYMMGRNLAKVLNMGKEELSESWK